MGGAGARWLGGGGTHSNHPAPSTEWDLGPGRLQVPCRGQNAWPVESVGSALPSNEGLWPPHSAQDARGHTTTPPARCQDILGKPPHLRPGRENTNRAARRRPAFCSGLVPFGVCPQTKKQNAQKQLVAQANPGNGPSKESTHLPCGLQLGPVLETSPV